MGERDETFYSGAMHSHFVKERHETVIEKKSIKSRAEEMLCGKDDTSKYIFVTPGCFNFGLDSE